jgi:hypothetical protein
MSLLKGKLLALAATKFKATLQRKQSTLVLEEDGEDLFLTMGDKIALYAVDGAGHLSSEG